jgi:hypothetical protein
LQQPTLLSAAREEAAAISDRLQVERAQRARRELEARAARLERLGCAGPAREARAKLAKMPAPPPEIAALTATLATPRTAATQALLQREYFDTDFSFGAAMRDMAEFFEALLPRLPALRIPIERDDRPPVILYTDAMYNPRPSSRIPAVIIDDQMASRVSIDNVGKEHVTTEVLQLDDYLAREAVMWGDRWAGPKGQLIAFPAQTKFTLLSVRKRWTCAT